VEDGYVTLPEHPGLGFEGKAALAGRMRALAE
jgi:L-alanine-DL-glutamate epimerase-like enolase superfamily enzyme